MTATTTEPAIFVSTHDYDRLISLAMGLERRDPGLAEFLIGELERATLFEPPSAGVDAVTMYSHVEFRSEPDGRTQCVTLVYPGEENIAEGRVSVLTPIGAALIGMTEGQAISWAGRDGQEHRLTVLEIHGSADQRSDQALVR